MRLVIDSNIIISHLLLPGSKPAWAVQEALRRHTILMSDLLLLELGVTLGRNKFDKYLSLEERRQFLYKLHKITEPVAIVQRVQACRDEDDNMVLELAINGSADAIISGDKDLLALHPFRDIPILTAENFLVLTA